MEDEARQVMDARVEPAQVVIERVREPRHRHPVAALDPEHPLDRRPAERADVPVLDSVDRVVPIDEPVAEHREVDRDGDGRGEERRGPD